LRPTKTLDFSTSHFALFGAHPDLSHLRVFGYKCYPNLSATAPNKLAPRSTVCVFLGYPTEHNGYRCLDLATNRIIISRHVMFDESVFLFAEISTPPSSHFDFLSYLDCTPLPIGTNRFAGTPLPVPGTPATGAPPAGCADSPAPGAPPARGSLLQVTLADDATVPTTSVLPAGGASLPTTSTPATVCRPLT